MNDTFSFEAPAEMFRRRLDPRWVRAGVLLALAVVAVGTFGRWVVASEHAADARRDAALEALREPAASPVVSPAALDDEAAQAASLSALSVARDVFDRTGSFEGASTGALAEELPDLIFVDGPSTAPMIVSVEAGADAWAAAVMGQDATCFWVRVAASGSTRYGGGADCTGEAAKAAELTAWTSGTGS